ncbi:MAG: type II secretion system F family protein [Burkholderiaceae bacterium]
MPTTLDWVLFIAGVLTFVGIYVTLRRLGGRYRLHFQHTVGTEMGRSFLFIDANRLMWFNLLLAMVVVSAAIATTGSIWVAALAASLAGILPRVLLWRIRVLRQRHFRAQLPEMIGMLASSLKAGVGLSTALADLAGQVPAPMRQELSLMLREQRLGSTLDQAFAGLERRMPLEETRLLVSAVRIGLKAGGGMAGTLESLAAALRRRLLLEGKIRALTAQAKMQAWVMGLLPFGVLAAMVLLDPLVGQLYFAHPAGWIVLGIVAVLQAVGAWVIRRMVSIEI